MSTAETAVVSVTYNAVLAETVIASVMAGPAGLNALSPTQGIAFVRDALGSDSRVATHVGWGILAPDTVNRIEPMLAALYGREVATLAVRRGTGEVVDTKGARANRRALGHLLAHVDAMRRDGSLRAVWAAEAALLAQRVDPRVPIEGARTTWLIEARANPDRHVDDLVEKVLNIYAGANQRAGVAACDRLSRELRARYADAIALWCRRVAPAPVEPVATQGIALACGALALRCERLGNADRAAYWWRQSGYAWEKNHSMDRANLAYDRVLRQPEPPRTSIADLASAALAEHDAHPKYGHGPHERQRRPVALTQQAFSGEVIAFPGGPGSPRRARPRTARATRGGVAHGVHITVHRPPRKEAAHGGVRPICHVASE